MKKRVICGVSPLSTDQRKKHLGEELLAQSLCAWQSGETEEAQECITTALELNPEQPQGKAYSAVLAELNRDTDRCIQEIQHLSGLVGEERDFSHNR